VTNVKVKHESCDPLHWLVRQLHYYCHSSLSCLTSFSWKSSVTANALQSTVVVPSLHLREKTPAFSSAHIEVEERVPCGSRFGR
jgi:hypothetical protein